MVFQKSRPLLRVLIHTIESTAGSTSEMIGAQNQYVNDVNYISNKIYAMAKQLTREVYKIINHTNMGKNKEQVSMNPHSRITAVLCELIKIQLLRLKRTVRLYWANLF